MNVRVTGICNNCESNLPILETGYIVSISIFYSYSVTSYSYTVHIALDSCCLSHFLLDNDNVSFIITSTKVFIQSSLELLVA